MREWKAASVWTDEAFDHWNLVPNGSYTKLVYAFRAALIAMRDRAEMECRGMIETIRAIGRLGDNDRTMIQTLDHAARRIHALDVDTGELGMPLSYVEYPDREAP